MKTFGHHQYLTFGSFLKKNLFILFTLLCSQALLAQNVKDNTKNIVTDTLKDAIVKDNTTKVADGRKGEFAPGLKVISIDTLTLQQYRLQSVANLLSQQVPVFVRSYGVNGLASLSFRGASAAQSAVYWNGIPIQNSALGIADVGELPVLFMSKINIVYGSSAALWGSGNIGGALILESEPCRFDSVKKSLSVSLGIGSFGQYSGGVEGSMSNKRWSGSIKFITQTAVNNFPYSDQNGNNTKMPNCKMSDIAIQLRLGYKISNSSMVGLSAWYQEYNREIPPALFEPPTYKKNDSDRSLRLLIDWDKYSGTNTWYAKSSFIKDCIIYNDDAVSLHSNNTSYQYYQEVGWKKQMYDYGQLLLFIPIQLSWMDSARSVKTLNRQAMSLSYEIGFFHKRLNVAVNTRDEVYQGKNNIFLPGANLSFSVYDWLSLKANAQKTYRTPTLNELYYNPGGNPELKPEQGWNEDAGYEVKAAMGKFTLYSSGAVYNRLIQDWIIWLGGAIWTPHNIAKVHSRGIETENKLEFSTGNWKLHAGLSTGYVLATTESSYIPNDGSIGKQIPYTPRYNITGNSGFQYKQLYFNYIHTYTGYRFTTSDNTENLLPYSTDNIQMMFKHPIASRAIQLSLQCNNIFNKQYQVVANRPMPEINWSMGIKVLLL